MNVFSNIDLGTISRNSMGQGTTHNFDFDLKDVNKWGVGIPANATFMIEFYLVHTSTSGGYTTYANTIQSTFIIDSGSIFTTNTSFFGGLSTPTSGISVFDSGDFARFALTTNGSSGTSFASIKAIIPFVMTE